MIRQHYVPLYQSACTSEKLADLSSDSHRLFYVLLLTHCDSWGRAPAGSRVLGAKVWPMLGKKPSDTEKALMDLERVGLVYRYEVGGSPFLAVPDWEEKAGKIGKLDRRGPSLYPDPPACRTSPANGPPVQDQSCLARARESERRGEERSQEERNQDCADPAQDRPWISAVDALVPPSDRLDWIDACASHAAHRRRWKHSRLQADTWEQRLRTWLPRGLSAFRAAVEASGEQGWQGLFPEKRAAGATKNIPAGAVTLRDMLADRSKKPSEAREVRAEVLP